MEVGKRAANYRQCRMGLSLYRSIHSCVLSKYPTGWAARIAQLARITQLARIAQLSLAGFRSAGDSDAKPRLLPRCAESCITLADSMRSTVRTLQQGKPSAKCIYETRIFVETTKRSMPQQTAWLVLLRSEPEMIRLGHLWSQCSHMHP